MSDQQIFNPHGAFGYNTTDGIAGNQRGDIRVKRLRNMSTASGIAVGQPAVWSSLVGEGNEVIPATTVLTGLQRFAGIAITSATTNNSTGTSNLSSQHPSAAWCDVVVEGPVEAWVTSATEKGTFLFQTNDTANGVTWGKLGPLSTAATTGNVNVIGWSLTTATSATTGKSRIYVKPSIAVGPTS